MSKINILILGLLCCVSANLPAQKLKIMSFNMQQPYGTNWEARMPEAVRIINTHQPDILGTQELHAYMKDQILSKISGYTAYGISRECDGSGEGSYIFFKADKYEIDSVNSGTFWYKKDYWICGKGYDSNYNRVCTYARLKNKSTGQYFYIYNSHFPTPDQHEARINSAKLLCNIADNRAVKDPVIFTGDFNSTENEGEPIRYIKSGTPLKMRDTYRDLYPTDSVTTGFGTRFDFIFTEDKPSVLTLSAYVVDSPVASDHLPIVAVIELNR